MFNSSVEGMTRGAPVVCLHSSASSGRQWRSLIAAGGDEFTWYTPDLYGHGTRPAWPDVLPSHLPVEADGVLATLGIPQHRSFHLVGHSYGGAVALQIAMQVPHRVRSLTLYEPAAFGVLPALGPAEPEWEEITDVAASLETALRNGDELGAARNFCAYWHGRDVWADMNLDQRVRVARTMSTVRRHFRALFAAQWSDTMLNRVNMPVLLLCGRQTRLSARRVARSLAVRLPLVRLEMLDCATHMAPITRSELVTARFVESLVNMQQLEMV